MYIQYNCWNVHVMRSCSTGWWNVGQKSTHTCIVYILYINTYIWVCNINNNNDIVKINFMYTWKLAIFIQNLTSKAEQIAHLIFASIHHICPLISLSLFLCRTYSSLPSIFNIWLLDTFFPRSWQWLNGWKRDIIIDDSTHSVLAVFFVYRNNFPTNFLILPKIQSPRPIVFMELTNIWHNERKSEIGVYRAPHILCGY